MYGLSLSSYKYVLLATCPLVDEMEDDTLLPDSAITLEPNPTGNPGDIRPTGPGWITQTLEDRVATLTVGKDLEAGGVVQLVDPINVKEYVVELIKAPQVNCHLKLSFNT